MRCPVIALLLTWSLLVATPVKAVDLSLGAGVADSHDGEASRVLDLSVRWPTSGRFKLIDEHELLAGWIESRRLPSLNEPVVYAGYGVRTNFGRWFTGAGVVVVSNTTDALSSWYQFVSTGGVHIGRASLTLRHLSNSGFVGRNRGETYLTLGFDW